jgi:tyrosyl-tRNA synthetase
MDNIDELLTRGVEQILPDKKGLASLMAKKKIKLYLGIDPTGSRLHLGHSIALRKLQQFADLGHETILLFGTGTVLAGDPSQRESARAKIAAEQINSNVSTWKDQVKSIIDFNKVNIMFNGEWLLKLTLRDIIEIASNISAVQLFKRDMFQKRIEKGDTIWTHELLYPLLQGYDSVAMNVDLEIGGTDQTFNMLIGRELQEKMNKHQKYVLSVPMITGTDGKQMSKSSGNCVWLDDTPDGMFGKIMSISDSQILPYFRLLTNVPLQEIDKLEKGHPLEAKKRLASEIVTMYHSEKDAEEAQKTFAQTFQDKKPVFNIKVKAEETLAKTLIPFSPRNSMASVKELLRQGAVDINGTKATEGSIKLKVGDEVKVGERTFLKVSK